MECCNFSHGLCYSVTILVLHTFVDCSKKSNLVCTNQTLLDRKNKCVSSDYKRTWVFELNRNRVLNSILNQGYVEVQPGNEPSEEFLNFEFGSSSAYSNRIILRLVKEGFIKFHGGFAYNRPRIKILLVSESMASPDVSQSISEPDLPPVPAKTTVKKPVFSKAIKDPP